MTRLLNLSTLSDQQPLSEVKIAADREARATVSLIALLAEVDARRLYPGEGCASLFTYCTQHLHLSEHAAYARIRQVPEPSRLQAVPPLDDAPGNAVAAPLVPASPPRPAVVAPVAPERFKVQLTIGRDTYDKLCRVQGLLRHSIPDGDLARVFDRAVSLLLADLERAKAAGTDRPRPGRPPASGSRHIPTTVRREVWKRDGGQCAFVGTEGRLPRARLFRVPSRRAVRRRRPDGG